MLGLAEVPVCVGVISSVLALRRDVTMLTPVLRWAHLALLGVLYPSGTCWAWPGYLCVGVISSVLTCSLPLRYMLGLAGVPVCWGDIECAHLFSTPQVHAGPGQGTCVLGWYRVFSPVLYPSGTCWAWPGYLCVGVTSSVLTCSLPLRYMLGLAGVPVCCGDSECSHLFSTPQVHAGLGRSTCVLGWQRVFSPVLYPLGTCWAWPEYLCVGVTVSVLTCSLPLRYMLGLAGVPVCWGDSECSHLFSTPQVHAGPGRGTCVLGWQWVFSPVLYPSGTCWAWPGYLCVGVTASVLTCPLPLRYMLGLAGVPVCWGDIECSHLFSTPQVHAGPGRGTCVLGWQRVFSPVLYPSGTCWAWPGYLCVGVTVSVLTCSLPLRYMLGLAGVPVCWGDSECSHLFSTPQVHAGPGRGTCVLGWQWVFSPVLYPSGTCWAWPGYLCVGVTVSVLTCSLPLRYMLGLAGVPVCWGDSECSYLSSTPQVHAGPGRGTCVLRWHRVFSPVLYPSGTCWAWSGYLCVGVTASVLTCSLPLRYMLGLAGVPVCWGDSECSHLFSTPQVHAGLGRGTCVLGWQWVFSPVLYPSGTCWAWPGYLCVGVTASVLTCSLPLRYMLGLAGVPVCWGDSECSHLFSTPQVHAGLGRSTCSHPVPWVSLHAWESTVVGREGAGGKGVVRSPGCPWETWRTGGAWRN